MSIEYFIFYYLLPISIILSFMLCAQVLLNIERRLASYGELSKIASIKLRQIEQSTSEKSTDIAIFYFRGDKIKSDNDNGTFLQCKEGILIKNVKVETSDGQHGKVSITMCNGSSDVVIEKACLFPIEKGVPKIINIDVEPKGIHCV